MPFWLAKAGAMQGGVSDRRVIGALDVVERVVVAGFYGMLTWRLLAHYLATHNTPDLLALASETMVVALIVIRRPARAISVRLSDWALALGGTCAGMLLRPAAGSPLAPQYVVLALQGLGLAGQLWCKASLFRNFGLAPALRGLTSQGPYGLLRHPMYASYFVAEVGYLLAYPTARNACVLGVWAIAQVLRIEAEEAMLRRDADYRAYAEKVRWRMLPGVY